MKLEFKYREKVFLYLLVFITLGIFHEILTKEIFLPEDISVLGSIDESIQNGNIWGDNKTIPNVIFAFFRSISGHGQFLFNLSLLVIHCLNVILLYFLLKKFVPSQVVLMGGTILFALNPVHLNAFVSIQSLSLLLTESYVLFVILYSSSKNSIHKDIIVLIGVSILAMFTLNIGVFAILLSFIILNDKIKNGESYARYIFIALCTISIVFAYTQLNTEIITNYVNQFHAIYFQNSLFTFISYFFPVSILFSHSDVQIISSISPWVVLAGLGLVLFQLKNDGKNELAIVLLILLILPVTSSDILLNVYATYYSFFVAFTIGAAYFIEITRRNTILHRLQIVFPILMSMQIITTVYQTPQIVNGDAYYSAMINADPNIALHYAQRGKYLQSHGKYERSLNDFSQAIRFDSSTVEYRLNRGLLFQELGRPQEAIIDYRNGIRLDSMDALLHYNMGNSFSYLSEYDSAIICYSKSININPSLFQAWNNRGNIYIRQGLYVQALADYTMSLKYYPTYDNAIRNIGLLFLEIGEYGTASKQFSTLIHQQPHIASHHIFRGFISLQLGDTVGYLKDSSQAFTVDTSRNTLMYYTAIKNIFQSRR